LFRKRGGERGCITFFSIIITFFRENDLVFVLFIFCLLFVTAVVLVVKTRENTRIIDNSIHQFHEIFLLLLAREK
jgi:hypothetical protein